MISWSKFKGFQQVFLNYRFLFFLNKQHTNRQLTCTYVFVEGKWCATLSMQHGRSTIANLFMGVRLLRWTKAWMDTLARLFISTKMFLKMLMCVVGQFKWGNTRVELASFRVRVNIFWIVEVSCIGFFKWVFFKVGSFQGWLWTCVLKTIHHPLSLQSL